MDHDTESLIHTISQLTKIAKSVYLTADEAQIVATAEKIVEDYESCN